MSVEIIGVIGIIVMFILMALRVPIVISMAAPAIIGIYYIGGWAPLSTVLHTTVWQHTASYGLSTIPMFVLMGEMLFVSGVTNELFNMFRKWFGSIRGGLGMATIGSSAMFAAASGSSLANTGTMGTIASKEMLKSGYGKSLTGGSIVAGGTLGILIPPSTTFIIYGIITETSIGQLLLAGIIPGIILALLYISTIYLSVLIQPQLGPPIEKVGWKEKFKSIKPTLWIIVLFILVIGGMYLGFFSPTEAAGVGAFGATIIAVLRKRLTLLSIAEALINTLRTTSFIFAIIIGAFILNYFLSITNVSRALADFVNSLNVSFFGLFLVLILMYLVLGAIMDTLAMMVVTIPIILPLLMDFGVDLVWFGVVMVILIEMAMITPPIGMLCFVLDGVAPELGLNNIFKGSLRFIIPMLIMIFLLYIIPQLALLIPSTAY